MLWNRFRIIFFEENSPVIGWFPSHRASDAESVAMP